MCIRNDMHGHTHAHTHTQETDLLLWCITVANILSRSSGTFQETTSQKYHLSLWHIRIHAEVQLTDIWFDHAISNLLLCGKVTLWPTDLTNAHWQSNCILWEITVSHTHTHTHCAIPAQRPGDVSKNCKNWDIMSSQFSFLNYIVIKIILKTLTKWDKENRAAANY